MVPFCEWETYEIPHDKLQCGHCGKIQKAGGFTDTPPAPKVKQQCLICNGKGVLST